MFNNVTDVRPVINTVPSTKRGENKVGLCADGRYHRVYRQEDPVAIRSF